MNSLRKSEMMLVTPLVSDLTSEKVSDMFWKNLSKPPVAMACKNVFI